MHVAVSQDSSFLLEIFQYLAIDFFSLKSNLKFFFIEIET